ncbi:MAG: Bax inhibitor-1 family protein [Rubripirellula sp.]|jgi:FtsH-binding integral membrane protein|nr:Bax inhibitor-1 family protein [Rubripirellula sp.]
MSHIDQSNPYAIGRDDAVAYLPENARTTFLRKTYSHLTGAILALIGLEFVLLNVVPEPAIRGLVARMTSGYGWLVVLGLFMLVSFVAQRWAMSGTSKAAQYGGLSLYIGAWGVMLLPMLYICINVLGEPNLPAMAGLITAMAFMGLTAFVFITKVDLESWGKYLMIAGFVFLGIIIAGMIFGFSMGLWLSGALVAFACAHILYDTSNVLHRFGTDQYVAASLILFADVVLLFWYVLQILMSLSRD